MDCGGSIKWLHQSQLGGVRCTGPGEDSGELLYSTQSAWESSPDPPQSERERNSFSCLPGRDRKAQHRQHIQTAVRQAGNCEEKIKTTRLLGNFIIK